jgi:hypothetical protein
MGSQGVGPLGQTVLGGSPGLAPFADLGEPPCGILGWGSQGHGLVGLYDYPAQPTLVVEAAHARQSAVLERCVE